MTFLTRTESKSSTSATTIWGSYAAATAVCFLGASTTRATPIKTSRADPTRNPVRWLVISNPGVDITAARAKLDHAAKAIRLRCAPGFRAEVSRNTPSAKYRRPPKQQLARRILRVELGEIGPHYISSSFVAVAIRQSLSRREEGGPDSRRFTDSPEIIPR